MRLETLFFKAPKRYVTQTSQQHTSEGGGVKGPKM